MNLRQRRKQAKQQGRLGSFNLILSCTRASRAMRRLASVCQRIDWKNLLDTYEGT